MPLFLNLVTAIEVRMGLSSQHRETGILTNERSVDVVRIVSALADWICRLACTSIS